MSSSRCPQCKIVLTPKELNAAACPVCGATLNPDAAAETPSPAPSSPPGGAAPGAAPTSPPAAGLPEPAAPVSLGPAASTPLARTRAAPAASFSTSSGVCAFCQEPRPDVETSYLRAGTSGVTMTGGVKMSWINVSCPLCHKCRQDIRRTMRVPYFGCLYFMVIPFVLFFGAVAVLEMTGLTKDAAGEHNRAVGITLAALGGAALLSLIIGMPWYANRKRNQMYRRLFGDDPLKHPASQNLLALAGMKKWKFGSGIGLLKKPPRGEQVVPL